MALKLTVTEKRPRIFTVLLEGPLDTATHAFLDHRIDVLRQEGGARVVTLDFSGVTFISSMGVRSVLKAEKDLGATGGALLMVNLPPPVKKVFEIVNALPSMRIFANLAEMDDYLARMQSEV